ncbi:MAG: ABC transporter ATP-binding protein [Bdellovibrionales bacterium]
MAPILEVKDFHKSFGDKSIHQGTSFKLEKGECLGLLGGSGTGKSVVLRALIGLETPDSGEIIYKDQTLADLSETEWFNIRKEIAYVFQNGALFDSLSVYENLAFPLRRHSKFSEDEIKKRIQKILSDLDLPHAEGLFPAELSGGMQKRVGLARSLMLEPEVVLFDEPTAGLDPKNTIVIQDTIIKLKKLGYTSIFVTHDMPSALKVCDRIVLLRNKKIEAEATAEELKDQNHPIIKFMTGDTD